VSGYFDKLAARALGEPARLAPPPRLRFGDPAGLDRIGPVPGEHTVVTEVAAQRPVGIEPRPPAPLPVIDGALAGRFADALAPPTTPPVSTPDPGPNRITERTRTVEREIVVREPAADDERSRAEPRARSVVEGGERPPTAPVLASESRSSVAAPASNGVLGAREPERAVARNDLRSRSELEEPARVRPLEARPVAPDPVAVAPAATAVDADHGASALPVTIAIGRIELRAPAEAVASPPPPAERPRRPPRKPALGLDEYLEQRSRG
jgi:hypothetical protein